ncbi:MAG TPA: hypothetical protein VNI20_05070, partial [Fimbriimonadaceae bacterium]|nr:hypothetical protein [Fimbriimonadaceae bacterium]
MRRIGIVSYTSDVHGLTIAQQLEAHSDLSCHYFEIERLATDTYLTWAAGSDMSATIEDRDGHRVIVSDLDLLWMRRYTPLGESSKAVSEVEPDLVRNEKSAALLGTLLTEFKGKWVNHPEANRRATNKLVQLKCARECGLRLPQTLVTNCLEDVKRFAESTGTLIVKPIMGTRKKHLLTVEINVDELDEEAVRMCPAIYQEKIEGSDHLRACCFGDRVYVARLTSDSLDWRANLDIPCEPFEVGSDLEDRLRTLLARLELRMGVMDLKIDLKG